MAAFATDSFTDSSGTAQILELASYYPVEADEEVEAIGRRAKETGFLTKGDLLTIAQWKLNRYWTKGEQAKLDSNSDEFVERVTRTALSTPCEQLRIEVLTLLRGISYATAS